MHNDKHLQDTINLFTDPDIDLTLRRRISSCMRAYTDQVLDVERSKAEQDILHELALFGTDQIQFWYEDKGFCWYHSHHQQIINEGVGVQSLIDYVKTAEISP